jgi:hypothetical protein
MPALQVLPELPAVKLKHVQPAARGLAAVLKAANQEKPSLALAAVRHCSAVLIANGLANVQAITYVQEHPVSA